MEAATTKLAPFAKSDVASFAKLLRPFLKCSSTQEAIEYAREVAIKQGKARDWPWNRIVHAFASNGGSAHWDKKIRHNIEEYRWERVARLSDTNRRKLLSYATNPRRRKSNAKLFMAVFREMKKRGGPSKIKNDYSRLKTTLEKIQYWNDLPGIGEKYAREIPMGSYDRYFRDGHFALDSRLRGLLNANDIRVSNYKTGESFYCAVAKKLGIKCWDLDRMLYERRDDIEVAIKQMRNKKLASSGK